MIQKYRKVLVYIGTFTERMILLKYLKI